jgi:hypothetical protein
MNLSFHYRVILGFVLFFIIALPTVFIWKASGDFYHTEIIYYDGEFNSRYHFRPSDAYLLIHNRSDYEIFLQYKHYKYSIPPAEETIFDVKGLSPVYIYKNKTDGMRSVISPLYKIIPTQYLENLNTNNN